MFFIERMNISLLAFLDIHNKFSINGKHHAGRKRSPAKGQDFPKGACPMESAGFWDFYNDDSNVSPVERAKIEFQVELIGRLVEARKAKGFTQQQLAEAAGLKQSAVARLERMKATPQIDTLVRLLIPLGYKLALVPRDERGATLPPEAHSALDDSEKSG